MEKSNRQKIKLLKVMEILERETDENNPITTSEMCKRLEAMGITCDRRTFYKDVACLQDEGYNITEKRKGHNMAYYIADRGFSVPELKILIDAVQAASFITQGKTEKFIRKIAALGGKHSAKLLEGNMVHFNSRKHSNESVYQTIDVIEQAITKRCKVSFLYFDLDENKNMVFRHKGEKYIMEPLSLIFMDNNYYLVAYNGKYKSKNNYRLDRMAAPEKLEEHISAAAMREMREIEIINFVKTSFSMYSGERKYVSLKFDERLTNSVIDHFGEDTVMIRTADNKICASVQVQISTAFFGWLAQFADGMSVTYPEDVRERYRAHIEKTLASL